MDAHRKEVLRWLVFFAACTAAIGCGEPGSVETEAGETPVTGGKSDDFNESKDEGSSECVADEAISMPSSEGPWTVACSDAVVRAVTSEKLSSTAGTVQVGLRCNDLAGTELLAVEQFIAYHDDLDSFLNGYDWVNDGDGIPLKYEVDVHAEGTVANVEGPNDMRITMVFDDTLSPLLAFEFGDGSKLTAYCEHGSEPTASPTEACFHHMVNDMRQGEGATGDYGLSNLEQAEDDYGVLTVAARQFTADFELEPTDEFNFELIQWERGAEVTLWAEGVDKQTYHVTDYYQGWQVLARENAEGSTLMCDE